MPARPGVCKGAAAAAHGRQKPDDLHGTVLGLQDLDRLPLDPEADAGVGNVAQMLDDQAIERLRAVEAELRAEPAVERPQRRHAVDDDAAVRLAAEALRAARRLRRELADDLLDDVLDRDEALAARRIRRRRARAAARSAWNCCSCVEQRRAGRDEIGRAQQRRAALGVELAALHAACTTLFSVQHADDVVERRRS